MCTTDCITVAGGENTTVDALYQRFGPEVQAGKQLFLESTIQTATSGMSTLSLTSLSQLVAPWFAGCAMACWLHRGVLVAPWRFDYIVVCWLCHRMLVTAWRAGYAMACWLPRGVLVTPWCVVTSSHAGYAMDWWLHRRMLVTPWRVGYIVASPVFKQPPAACPLFYHCDCVGYIMVSSLCVF